MLLLSDPWWCPALVRFTSAQRLMLQALAVSLPGSAASLASLDLESVCQVLSHVDASEVVLTPTEVSVDAGAVLKVVPLRCSAAVA